MRLKHNAFVDLCYFYEFILAQSYLLDIQESKSFV